MNLNSNYLNEKSFFCYANKIGFYLYTFFWREKDNILKDVSTTGKKKKSKKRMDASRKRRRTWTQNWGQCVGSVYLLSLDRISIVEVVLGEHEARF